MMLLDQALLVASVSNLGVNILRCPRCPFSHPLGLEKHLPRALWEL